MGKLWIQNIEVRKTRLRRWAEEKGYEDLTDEAVDAALAHEDPIIRRQARFARAIRKTGFRAGEGF